VPADEDEGEGGDVHYVTVDQDPGESPEVGVSACADEGKLTTMCGSRTGEWSLPCVMSD
jgi:hypothetical protein